MIYEPIITGEGTIRDIEKNVLELCRQAFDEAEFLKYEEDYRPAYSDFYDCDFTPMRISDLPTVFAWVESEMDLGNEVGGMIGKPQRNLAVYTVVVTYMTHFSLPIEGHHKVRQIGDRLKRKLVEHSNLFDIANAGGRMKSMDFDPRTVLKGDGGLGPVSAVTIVMEYSLVERQRRALRDKYRS